MRLLDCASVLRSKNAGPLFITFDIMFPDREMLERVWNSGALTTKAVAERYRVSEQDVRITVYEIVHSIKVTIPRACVSGSREDTDIYGCQQHLLLAELPVLLEG